MRPIFVVGAPRSGTTLLRLILDSHPRISCGPETHFLKAQQAIYDTHESELAPFGYDEREWACLIAGMFDKFQRRYMEDKGKRRWADKTPAYARIIPFIDKMFPRSQFVHIIRNGEDVVASHRDRWGYIGGARAALHTWKRHVASARRDGASLGTARYLEIRYEEFVSAPEATVRNLLAFLDESWDPSMLDFAAQDHDDAARPFARMELRRQQAGTTARIYTHRANGSNLDFPLRLLLRTTSGRLMKELGYR